MTTDLAAVYAEEIRAYLIGRLARRRTIGASVASRSEETTRSPAALWWMFEGRRYEGLDGSLSASWNRVHRMSQQLLLTYNPTRRLVHVPEGDTDWLRSALETAVSAAPVFVSRVSGPGLQDEEKLALLAWLEWTRVRWAEYVEKVGLPAGSLPTVPWPPVEGVDHRTSDGALRRLAHTARRSRWPLLRSIVADSIRCYIEPQELDRLPLPEELPSLFELLCMVRILRTFEARPPCLRWIHPDLGDNEARIPGMTYAFQRSLPRKSVLATDQYPPALRAAVERHGVRVPGRMDGWLRFDEPRGGFAGILVEAKSGTQEYHAAVDQLRCYRAALRSEIAGPVVVWGIVEEEPSDGRGDEALRALAVEWSGGGPPGDVWVFSSAARIPEVLETLWMIPRSRRP